MLANTYFSQVEVQHPGMQFALIFVLQISSVYYVPNIWKSLNVCRNHIEMKKGDVFGPLYIDEIGERYRLNHTIVKLFYPILNFPVTFAYFIGISRLVRRIVTFFYYFAL